MRTFVISLCCLLSACSGGGGVDAGAGYDAGVPDGGRRPGLTVDRTSLGFGREFGSGTFIGAMPEDTLLLTNSGDADLLISSVTRTGDPAFAAGAPSRTLLKATQSAFVRVVFKPTEVRLYTGSVEIVSNAADASTTAIALSGCGIGADGGRPDGGC